MKSMMAGLGVAVLAAAFAAPAMAQDTACVTSGTGLIVSSGTAVPVTPGTRMNLIPGSTIRYGAVVSQETVPVSAACSTAIMGAPAGSTVTITRYEGPVPPANGYLAGDYQRYLHLRTGALGAYPR